MARPKMLPFSAGYEFAAAKIITLQGVKYFPGQQIDKSKISSQHRLRALYEQRKIRPLVAEQDDFSVVRPAVAEDLGIVLPQQNQDGGEGGDALDRGADNPEAQNVNREPGGDDSQAGNANAAAAGDDQQQPGSDDQKQPGSDDQRPRGEGGDGSPQEPAAGDAPGDAGGGSGGGAAAGGEAVTLPDVKPDQHLSFEEAQAALKLVDLAQFGRPIGVEHKGFGNWWIQDVTGKTVVGHPMKKAVAQQIDAEILAKL